jgi:hypothetical protein
MKKVGKLRQSSAPKEGMTYHGVLKPDASRERGHRGMSSLVHSERKAS